MSADDYFPSFFFFGFAFGERKFAVDIVNDIEGNYTCREHKKPRIYPINYAPRRGDKQIPEIVRSCKRR